MQQQHYVQIRIFHPVRVPSPTQRSHQCPYHHVRARLREPLDDGIHGERQAHVQLSVKVGIRAYNQGLARADRLEPYFCETKASTVVQNAYGLIRRNSDNVGRVPLRVPLKFSRHFPVAKAGTTQCCWSRSSWERLYMIQFEQHANGSDIKHSTTASHTAFVHKTAIGVNSGPRDNANVALLLCRCYAPMNSYPKASSQV